MWPCPIPLLPFLVTGTRNISECGQPALQMSSDFFFYRNVTVFSLIDLTEMLQVVFPPPWIHKSMFFNCPGYHRSVQMQLLQVWCSRYCHSTCWNLSQQLWVSVLETENLPCQTEGENPVEFAVFTSFCMGRNSFCCSHFGQNQRLLNKAELQIFSSILSQWYVDFSWYNFMDWVLKQWGKYVYY